MCVYRVSNLEGFFMGDRSVRFFSTFEKGEEKVDALYLCLEERRGNEYGHLKTITEFLELTKREQTAFFFASFLSLLATYQPPSSDIALEQQ